MKRLSKPRAAFTLIELLVVMGIIALLATLSVAAVLRVREGQRESNTSTQLRKIQMGLDQRWKATVERIKTEDVPSEIRELTKNANGSYDNDRARALHMKLRLRAEFPQTFAEADPTKFAAAYPILTPVFQSNPKLLTLYGPKPLFAAPIAGLNDTADNESAVLLMLILAQTGGGITFDVDGAGGVQTVPIGGNAGKMMKVYVDYYGQPVAFRRWADNQDSPQMLNAPPQGVVAELSSPPFASGANPDAQDPGGRLKLPANQWFQNNRTLAVSMFISAVPQQLPRPAFDQNFNPLDGANRGPFVFSAGKDGDYYSTDNNMFSFRLQATGKGGP
jgi:prepilin-type N-terminal cleavage/methylation domain-containing protein